MWYKTYEMGAKVSVRRRVELLSFVSTSSEFFNFDVLFRHELFNNHSCVVGCGALPSNYITSAEFCIFVGKTPQLYSFNSAYLN